MMGDTNRRNGLLGVVAVLFIGSILLQTRISPMRAEFVSGFDPSESKKTQLMLELPNQMLGAVAIGFKEAIAAVLWVRADEFFHTGNYEAILPITRLVTWLDPHQLDVYSTGAWHLDYNFTDSESRSDRRYIPPAISLLKEGIANNPKIYDLYFELGWTHYYQKIKDYKNAAYWIEQSAKYPSRDPNTGKVIERPAFVEHMLAHCYEQTGDYAKSEKIWRKLIAKAQAELKEKVKAAEKKGKKLTEEDIRQAEAMHEIEVCVKNLSGLLLRQGFRYGDMAAYRRGLEVTKLIPKPDPIMKKAITAARAQYEQIMAEGRKIADVNPPVDCKLNVKVYKKAPKVLVVEGTANMIPESEYANLAVNAYTSAAPNITRQGWVNYARLYIVLTDLDYKPVQLETFTWDVDPKQTIMQTDTQVNMGKFNIVIDMSKDPKQYPFAKKKYKLTVFFDPRLAPEEIQDRIGWLGEGITDKNYLDTHSVPGVKMLKFEKVLDLKDII